jgi:hypothetical protein
MNSVMHWKRESGTGRFAHKDRAPGKLKFAV